jgi:Flp pilus assembly pilin Flp
MTSRPLRRLARDSSGATIVEFAILLVPLLAVVLGFTELGYQSYVRSTLQGTLNDVARVAAVEDPKLGDDSLPLDQRIENHVKERMSTLVNEGSYDFKISNYQNFSAVGRPEALVTDKNKNGKYDSGDCWEDNNPNGTFDTEDGGGAGVGGADDVVVYEVTLSVPHLLPVEVFVAGDDSFEVRASTMIRVQPYADQEQPEVKC